MLLDSAISGWVFATSSMAAALRVFTRPCLLSDINNSFGNSTYSRITQCDSKQYGYQRVGGRWGARGFS